MAYRSFSILLMLSLALVSIGKIPAQQRGRKPAFTLWIAITTYDASGVVLSVNSATRFQSGQGDWRYAGNFGNNVYETISRIGRGVFFGDSKSSRLIKMSNQAADCAETTAEELRRDPKFARTESIFGLTAYGLRERISTYTVETFFVPSLGRIPFKRSYDYDDGHRKVEEPLRLVMGEPLPEDVSGPDYPVIEETPIFNDRLDKQLVLKPEPAYPTSRYLDTITGNTTIVVQVIVDTTGRVISVRPITQQPLLAEAAVDAAYLALFSPTIMDGQAVVSTGVLRYTFEPQKKLRRSQ